MGQVIIHRTENNGLAITYKVDTSLSMLEAGYRCVPEGVKFKILDESIVDESVDYDFLEAFDYDFENDFDAVGMNDTEWKTYLENKNN